MQRGSLTTLTTLFLTCGMSILACGGGAPGTTVETTTESSGGATTSGTTGEPTTSTTSGTTSDTPTSEPATTTGDSDSGTGTTTGASTGDSTGPVTSETTTGASTTDETTGASTGVGTTGETTGGGAEPVSFAECQEGMAAACPELDPACLVVDGPGGFGPNGSFFVTWSYCTRECESDADCVSGLPGGSAKPRCLAKGANDIKVCVLDCSFGKTCPEGLECSNDDACGTKFCDCSGDGCQDDLCV